MLRLGLMSALGVVLAGCTSQPAEQPANTTEVTTTTAAGGVTRQEITAEPTPAAAPAPAAIQTQPGPKGAQVALNRVAVTGDIMTVSLTITGSECCSHVPVDQIALIDDATSQRISVLKDNAGNWMAAPLDTSKDDVLFENSKTAPAQIWFKFPAPPATSKTVSLTIPGVAPFDAVPVAR